MTSDRWQQVQALCLATVKRDPGEGVAFLDQACMGDSVLRREVESLLAMHDTSDDLLANPVGAAAAKLLAQDATQLHAGQIVGAYRIEREIGRGGMGEVYLACDTRLDRPVALKRLPANFAGDADRVTRFQREARASSSLNHPNIVTIHEVAESDGQRFIVSEFVDGKTLRELMRYCRLSLDQVLDIAIQTASALSAAHHAGIVHRDIKPENIM